MEKKKGSLITDSWCSYLYMLNEKKIFALKKGIWCVYIACEDVCLNVIAGERLKVNSFTSVFFFLNLW